MSPLAQQQHCGGQKSLWDAVTKPGWIRLQQRTRRQLQAETRPDTQRCVTAAAAAAGSPLLRTAGNSPPGHGACKQRGMRCSVPAMSPLAVVLAAAAAAVVQLNEDGETRRPVVAALLVGPTHTNAPRSCGTLYHQGEVLLTPGTTPLLPNQEVLRPLQQQQ